MKQRKVPQNVKMELMRDIISWQLKGYAFSEISASVQERLASYKITKELCNRLVLEAGHLMRQENDEDIMLTIDNHTFIYEEVYKWFNEYGDIAGKNRAMYAKEKMLGLHRDDTSLVINNKVTVEEKEIQYDINKLTGHEQTRLRQLIDKSKKK